MVKFLLLFFCITQFVWGSLTGGMDVVEVSAATDHHMKIFKAIMDGDERAANNCMTDFKGSLISEAFTREKLEDSIRGNRGFFKHYENPDISKRTQLRNSAIVCGAAAAAELARFSCCTDDSWCYWMPPALAATAGGNFAFALITLTNSSYILGGTCAVAFGVAALQHVQHWTSVPGFFNPVAGNLIGFFGKKLLLSHDSQPKISSLSDYFSRVKPEMSGLLSEYLSIVALAKEWKNDKTLLNSLALVHLRTLELGLTS